MTTTINTFVILSVLFLNRTELVKTERQKKMAQFCALLCSVIAASLLIYMAL